MFYKLKIKDWLYLLVLIILTYVWISIDQNILSESYQRMIAFPTLGLILMLIFQILVKPTNPLKLSNTMAIILVPLFIAMSLLFHVILNNDFQTISILLWIITLIIIYLSGLLYRIFLQKKA